MWHTRVDHTTCLKFLMSAPKKKGKWDSSDEESDNGKTSKRLKTSKSSSLVKAVDGAQESASEPIVKEKVVEEIVVSIQTEAGVTEAKVERSAEVVSVQETNVAPAETQKEPVATEDRKHNPIFDGCRSVDSYQRINFIDQGTYGMVFKAKCRETGEMYALKQIKFGPETNKVGFPITALREINILLALQHPNIVRVKEMVVGSSIDKIYMVMEYCENDLKTCMKMSKQSFSTAEVSYCYAPAVSLARIPGYFNAHRPLSSINR